MGAVLAAVGVALTVVVCAPIALSAHDIIDWAGSPDGLALHGHWPLVVFFALDAAAAVCVGLVVYCTWRGEGAGLFSWLVWLFALTSAYANHKHGMRPGAPGAAWWFFPTMSLAGPFLLEVVMRKVRKWIQEGTGKRARHGVSFDLARWIPGVGALRETYGAWRLARLIGLDDADEAIRRYRALCPTGSIRVLPALREQERLYGGPTTPTVQTRPTTAPAPTTRPIGAAERPTPTTTPTPTGPAPTPTGQPTEPTANVRPIRSAEKAAADALLLTKLTDQFDTYPGFPTDKPSLADIKKADGGCSPDRAIRIRKLLIAEHANRANADQPAEDPERAAA